MLGDGHLLCLCGGLPQKALMEKRLLSLKDDNNYICLITHSMSPLISSEMEISNPESLLTELPLSVTEHLLTLAYKNLSGTYVCAPVYTNGKSWLELRRPFFNAFRAEAASPEVHYVR